MLADEITEISKIEIIGLTDEGLCKLIFSGQCWSPILSVGKNEFNISFQYNKLRYEEVPFMSRYGNYDMEHLYNEIVNCELELDDIFRVFGDALLELIERDNGNLVKDKQRIENVLCRISKYSEDIRDKSFISIKELEELIK